jgi:hypothetical protein
VLSAAATLALVVLAAVPQGRASAQQPAGLVTGTVTDATTGTPVSGALLSVLERGPRSLTDPQGRFRIANVPLGTQTIRVQRFGYRDLELSVSVSESTAPIEVRLQVDPVALEGITARGGVEVSVGGVVLDASTGKPVPWAELSLTRDAMRDLGRAAADGQGVFSIDDVMTGRYLLRAERVGYEGQYIPIDVAAPPEALEVRLTPDSAIIAGIAALEQRLSSRRNASPSVSQSWGEDRLRLSAMRGMRQFLENDAMLNLMPCNGRNAVNDCRVLRGNMVAPRVYIDELRAADLDELNSYEPYELYKVDVFVCGPGDRMGGWEIRAYTYEFVERQARRGRAMFASCFVP